MKNSLTPLVIVALVLALLVIGASVGLFIYESVREGEMNTSSLVRMLLLVAAALLTVGRLLFQRKASRKNVKHSIAYYREKYAPVLGRAFLADKKAEKKFFRAVEDYVNDRYAPAVKTFAKLLKTATSGADRYALLAFLGFSYEDMQMYARAAELYRAAESLCSSELIEARIAFCESKM